ncbi:carbohydrate ABC transporter permease [Kribbella deserti]|uniref:Carbohydrate ABC transporter permease n=1 Tax=Kribbella deserti TaxID=1926257 RepID=A0ABV6QDJ0_9ACTN
MTRTTATRSPLPQSPARDRAHRWDLRLSPYLYIAPFFLLFCLVGLFPLAYTAYVALHKWELGGSTHEFVGLQNFADLLADGYFWNALFNTVSIFVLSSVPQIVIAIVLAALLDTRLRGKTFWRMSVLLPYVVAPVAVAIIFGNLFGDRFGLVNAGLELLSLPPIDWHTERLPSHLAIATMVNWRWTGYNALIFLAAMQAIPRELYEAAITDGAGAIRRFFAVTVPMLRPTIIFVVVTSTIGGLQVFAEPLLFDSSSASVTGGTDRQFQTVTLYLYERAFRNQNLGAGSAVAWTLFLVVVLFAVLNYLLTRRIASADAGIAKKGRKA